jgi:hypothetical protein
VPVATPEWSRSLRLSPRVALLLLDGPFGGRNRLESSVRDWLTAFDRASVRTGCEPRLGAFKRGKLSVEILGTTGAELVLVEVFRIRVARFPAIRGLQRTFALKRGKRLFDTYAFACQQFLCAL